MDENGYNAVSHSAKATSEGAHRRKRILLVLAYVLFSIGYIFLFTVPVKMWPACGGLPFLLLVFVKITWWRLSFDYEYSIAGGGLLTVERVYTQARRKRLLEVRIKDAISITPYHKGEQPPRKPCYDFRGSPSSPDSYCIVYRDAEGKECAALIEVSARLVRMMSKFNPATVVAEGLRY